MRRLVFLTAATVLFGALAFAKNVKIHGYVTNLSSPTVFEIEDYRITRDQTLVLEFEKGEVEEPIEFHPEDIRVGTELEIKGEYNEETGELSAKSVKVFLEEHKKIKRTALIDRSPRLERAGDTWDGTFWADGQRIRVIQNTKVLFKPNRSERDALKKREKAERKVTKEQKGGSAVEEDPYIRPLESLDEIGPNTFMTYEGYRQEDGSVAATRVEFMRNELEKGEANLWKKLTPKIKEPDYTSFKPGEIRIPYVGKLKLLPSKEAQGYVQSLGEKLIPPYQKSLAPGDPNKIPFRFFIIQANELNAFALPNGVIVIHSSMFGTLENEAQLAEVLGHEIAHAVQEHQFREQEYHKKKRLALALGAAFLSGMGYYNVADILNMIEGAIRNGYSRALENQADRLGLEYMLEAGYDIREAPRVWKVMTKNMGDRPTNLFWDNHDNNTTRRSYLMAELRNNYSGSDYSRVTTGEGDFQRIAQLVRDSADGKKKVKVKY